MVLKEKYDGCSFGFLVALYPEKQHPKIISRSLWKHKKYCLKVISGTVYVFVKGLKSNHRKVFAVVANDQPIWCDLTPHIGPFL
jgi:hypothetical protein